MLSNSRSRWIIASLAILFGFNLMLSSLFPLVSSALSPEQKNLYNKNINYYEYDVCGGGAEESADDLAPGTGSPGGTTFPNLDPEAMAKGIDEYIEDTNPASKMKGLGAEIVKGGKKSNINPFLIVAIAQKESTLSSPDDYNVKNGSNSFGRTATSSQPHFEGARTWYKWSSVKASVDPDAAENKDTNVGDIAEYIRNSDFYDQGLKTNDITKIMLVYAPPSENDTTQYVQDIKTWTKKMIRLTKKHGGDSGTSGGSTEGVSYDANRATIDTDGSGSSGGSGSFQPQTNLRTNGKLNDDSTSLDAGKINFYVLYGAWAQKRDISLGDIAKVEYKGKTSYAVFGDNHGVGSPDSEWSEISSALARSFGGSGDGATGTLTGKIKYTIYPGSHKKLDVKPSAAVGVAATDLKMNELQGKIDELGAQLSGGTSTENSDSCCLAENTSTNLPGRNNKEKIWNYLVGELKLNDKQAAGVMGNMEQESGFDPKAENPDSGAYGIVQWYAGRKTALQNFAQEKGKSVSNLGVQLEFLKKELESDSYKSSVYEPLKNASSVAEATRIWLEKFEIPCAPPGSACDPEMNIRLPKAQDYFDKYGNGSADTSSSSSDDSPACSGGTNAGGVDGVSWPVKKSFWDQHQDWFTKPHHDHPSADIPVPSGTKLYSMVDGKVTIAGDSGACGVMVEVQYKEDRDVKIGYCHGTPGSLRVSVGDNVTSGQLLMLSDNTGESSGPHLHVQIHVNGQIRCPQQAFKDLGANKAVNFKGLPSSGCTN